MIEPGVDEDLIAPTALIAAKVALYTTVTAQNGHMNVNYQFLFTSIFYFDKMI